MYQLMKPLLNFDNYLNLIIRKNPNSSLRHYKHAILLIDAINKSTDDTFVSLLINFNKNLP